MPREVYTVARMSTAELKMRKNRLKHTIEQAAFVRGENEPYVVGKTLKNTGWLFDIKKILLDPKVLDDLGYLFSESISGNRTIQIGGLESASIPLVTGLVTHSYAKQPLNAASGFFIRKSRKREGLLKMIEGELRENVPIVLVDDVINSGKAFIRQTEILEKLGYRVEAVWVLVRYRDLDQYPYFADKGITIHSLFTLDDFTTSLGTHNLPPHKSAKEYMMPYRLLWKFSSPNPSYHFVVPKSDPTIDDERVYVGSDIGVMWALNQHDGSVAWQHKIGLHARGKGIFSSPAVHNGTVYFGGYDGNFYALDAKTGARKWVSFEADWIGSSPALAPELGLLFIGLEYGLWRKHGGIAAIDIKTGKTVWAYRDMPCYTHSSPFYIRAHRQVVIGSNDGVAYLFDAKDGKLIWRYESGTPTEKELDAGSSAYDIKESFAYDPKHDLIIGGNLAGELFFIKRKTGDLAHSIKTDNRIVSTPLLYQNTVIASSTDKHIYCIDLDTFEERWRWYGGARIFSSPVLIGESVYVGGNTGRLTELNPDTGEEKSFLTLTERITNRVAYNPTTKRFFVPTFTNEIYSIEKTGWNTPTI